MIDNWLVVPLSCISQLCYADYTAGATEAIQELTLYFPLTINGLRDYVCIPFKCNSFKGSHELFYQSVSFSASVTAGLISMK